MKRLPNGIIQDLYLQIETDTAKKRTFLELVERGDHTSIGSATAMASKVVATYVKQAQATEAVWMYAA